MIMPILKITPAQITYTQSADELLSAFFISKQVQKQITIKDHTIQCHFTPKSYQTSYQPVDILYEDETIIIANKPPFLLVHPDGNETDTLQSRINAYLEATGWPYPAQAVHRIDYETSGLVLFCKHPFFQAYYDHQMQEHRIEKEYICIVNKPTNYKNKKVTIHISKDRHNAKKMIVHPKGKEAISIFHTIQSTNKKSTIKVKIITGRKHQIRLQCQYLKHPIMNDKLYGQTINKNGLLLQSHYLKVQTPFQTIEITCPQEKRFNI